MAHFGGKYIDAGCVDGLRIPVNLSEDARLGITHNLSTIEVAKRAETNGLFSVLFDAATQSVATWIKVPRPKSQ
jgi:hypothetical protein